MSQCSFAPRPSSGSKWKTTRCSQYSVSVHSAVADDAPREQRADAHAFGRVADEDRHHRQVEQRGHGGVHAREAVEHRPRQQRRRGAQMLAAVVGIVEGVGCGAHWWPPGETELVLPVRPRFTKPGPLAASEVRQPEHALGSRSAAGSAKREADDQPAAGGVGGLDGRSVRLGDLAHDGQPEARARLRAPLRAAEEAVEELPQLVLRRPRTVVADLEHAVAQRDLDHAAGRAERGGVVEDVVDRAAEPVGHAGDHARLELGPEADPRRVAPRPRHRLGHQRVERHVLDRRVALVAARQLDEVAHEPAELLGLARPCRAAARAARPPRARRRRA